MLSRRSTCVYCFLFPLSPDTYTPQKICPQKGTGETSLTAGAVFEKQAELPR